MYATMDDLNTKRKLYKNITIYSDTTQPTLSAKSDAQGNFPDQSTSSSMSTYTAFLYVFLGIFMCCCLPFCCLVIIKWRRNSKYQKENPLQIPNAAYSSTMTTVTGNRLNLQSLAPVRLQPGIDSDEHIHIAHDVLVQYNHIHNQILVVHYLPQSHPDHHKVGSITSYPSHSDHDHDDHRIAISYFINQNHLKMCHLHQMQIHNLCINIQSQL